MELSQTTVEEKKSEDVEEKKSEVRVQLDLLQKELYRNGELIDQFRNGLSSVLRSEPERSSPDEKEEEELTPLASELRNMVSFITALNDAWKGVYNTIEL